MPHIFFDKEISPNCLLTTTPSALELRYAAAGRPYSSSMWDLRLPQR